MSTYEIISISLSFIAIIISLKVWISQSATNKMQNNMNIENRAPIISISTSILNENARSKTLIVKEEAFILPGKSFIVGRYPVIDKAAKVDVFSPYIAILNTSNNPDPKFKDYNFNTIQLRNSGATLKKIEFVKFFIKFKNGKELLLNRTINNDFYINEELATSMEITLYLSCFYDKDEYQLFDTSLCYSEEYIKMKYMLQGNSLIGMSFPSIADKYNEIEFELITTNLFDKEYRQRVTFSTWNNKFESKTTRPVFISKGSKRIIPFVTRVKEKYNKSSTL